MKSPTCFLFPRRTLGVSASKDGLPITGGKLALRTQKAWHQEVKERPQLQDIILERRQDERIRGFSPLLFSTLVEETILRTH